MSHVPGKTLIIKIGATGDVVRTTPLLRVLKGDIHWLTAGYNLTVLPPDCSNLTNVFSIESDISAIKSQQYDLVLSLDEDPALAGILPLLNYSRLIGVENKDGRQYSKEANGWFDMSLISRFDKQTADRLKFQNRKTYQELIFEAAGEVFNEHPYWINLPATRKNHPTIGIEKRVGSRWKGKAWWGYNLLAEQLQSLGFEIYFFSERAALQEYIKEIGDCDYIITGDTLAMHVALAYGLPTLSIFTCTSPWEICNYGLLKKVVSPLLEKSFYLSDVVPAAIEAISVEMVLQAFLEMTRSSKPGDPQ